MTSYSLSPEDCDHESPAEQIEDAPMGDLECPDCGTKLWDHREWD